MSDDYSAPLGLDRAAEPARWRLWPFAVALAVLGLAFVTGWAIFSRGGDGGEPSVTMTLPAAPRPQPVAPQAEPPDDQDGQIIIRDP